MEGRRATFITGIVVASVFIASIWLPTIDNCFNIVPGITGNEKSQLSTLPELRPEMKSILSFYNRFVRGFIDNFGFRNALIRWDSLLKLKLLKVDEFPKVLVGKEDWLYLIKDDEGNNALDYYRVTRPFNDDKEIAGWVRPLLEVKKRCDRKGVRFVLAIAPMKTRIYPEYIPRYLQPLRKTTRLDQLREYLRKNTDIDFIDMGQAVLEGKNKHIVFLKHDVHWNGYGAFCAYRMLAAYLSRFYPHMEPRTLDDYILETRVMQGGDLASMLGLKDMFSETVTMLKPKYSPRAVTVSAPYVAKSSRFSEFFESKNRSLKRAIVFHDSFFNFIKPHLAEHFSRMACFQSYNRIDLSLLDAEKPDVVIYEMAESFLQKSPAYVTPISD